MMVNMAYKLYCSFVLLGSLLSLVLGHGYIREPAARNACGQYGFKTCTMEWTMDEKNCGGFSSQWDKNGGKCGVCGDAYHLKIPTLVYPGRYATGTITKTYREGQEISLKLMITVSHKGWSEFRIGKIGTPPITEDKLVHVLRQPDGSPRWNHPGKKGLYTIKLRLPAGLTCHQCVLRWWWKTGNSWGCDSPGNCGLGKGAQESFVNCADVRIVRKDGVIPTDPPTVAPPETPVPTAGPPPSGKCRATGAWTGNANMDAWCNSNCASGNCPTNMCKCG